MNEYVINSITRNNRDNEVFKHQQHETINGISEVIEHMPKSEVLFEIDFNQIVPFNKLRSNFKEDDNVDDIFWNHVISLLFINTLYEKYFIETKHDLEDERRILTRDNVEEYFYREQGLVNRDDVIKTIGELNLDEPRLHVVLKYVNNENVIGEVMNYLNDDIPYPVKVYSDGEIQDDKLRGKHNLKVYDREDAGLDIKEVLGHSYEKKI